MPAASLARRLVRSSARARGLSARVPAGAGLIALVLAGPAQAAPPEAGEPPIDGVTEAAEAPENPEARKAAARAEVQAGNAAFKAGELQAAIDHYEAAMALLPAPKLHYNIGVCHQRLALTAETPEQRTRERELAIDSYNAYLEQNPRAEDRLEVAETIRELGGTPVTRPSLIDPVFDAPSEEEDEADAEGPEEEEEESETEDDPREAEPEPEAPPEPKHGRFGISLAGGLSPTLLRAQAVDAPALFAIDLEGGGFVGPRRRFLIAAHTSLYSGAVLRPDGLALYGYSLGLLFEQTWVLGRHQDAAMIGLGAVAALTGQSMTTREDVPPPLCAREGTTIATRSGGLVAPRFEINVLMGARRRSMIGLLIQPSFAVFGDGPRGPECSGDETPWTTVGIRRRFQFQMLFGLGYRFRF